MFPIIIHTEEQDPPLNGEEIIFEKRCLSDTDIPQTIEIYNVYSCTNSTLA